MYVTALASRGLHFRFFYFTCLTWMRQFHLKRNYLFLFLMLFPYFNIFCTFSLLHVMPSNMTQYFILTLHRTHKMVKYTHCLLCQLHTMQGSKWACTRRPHYAEPMGHSTLAHERIILHRQTKAILSARVCNIAFVAPLETVDGVLGTVK